MKIHTTIDISPAELADVARYIRGEQWPSPADLRGLFDSLSERIVSLETVVCGGEAGPRPCPPPSNEESERVTEAIATALGGKLTYLTSKEVEEMCARGEPVDPSRVKPDSDELAMVEALSTAKSILGPKAVALRGIGTNSCVLQSDTSDEPKVVAVGPTWERAIADAKEAVDAERKEVYSIKDDVAYDVAREYMDKFGRYGSKTTLTVHPGDFSINRVNLADPAGTPDRKFILARTFVEAIARYFGVSDLAAARVRINATVKLEDIGTPTA